MIMPKFLVIPMEQTSLSLSFTFKDFMTDVLNRQLDKYLHSCTTAVISFRFMNRDPLDAQNQIQQYFSSSQISYFILTEILVSECDTIAHSLDCFFGFHLCISLVVGSSSFLPYCHFVSRVSFSAPPGSSDYCVPGSNIFVSSQRSVFHHSVYWKYSRKRSKLSSPAQFSHLFLRVSRMKDRSFEPSYNNPTLSVQ